jgi:hypothetical protein
LGGGGGGGGEGQKQLRQLWSSSVVTSSLPLSLSFQGALKGEKKTPTEVSGCFLNQKSHKKNANFVFRVFELPMPRTPKNAIKKNVENGARQKVLVPTRVDLDLSLRLFDESFEFIAHCSYQNLRLPGAKEKRKESERKAEGE